MIALRQRFLAKRHVSTGTHHFSLWQLWGLPVKPPRLVDVSVKKPLIKVHISGLAGGTDSFPLEDAAGMACGYVFLARMPLAVLPSLPGLPRDANLSSSRDGRQQLIASGRQMVLFDVGRKSEQEPVSSERRKTFSSLSLPKLEMVD